MGISIKDLPVHAVKEVRICLYNNGEKKGERKRERKWGGGGGGEKEKREMQNALVNNL